MGVSIIGFGQIDVDTEHQKKIFDIFEKMVKHDAEDIDIDEQTLDFKMYGNNHIDYSILEKLKSYGPYNKLENEYKLK